jgi:hypothetical protein
VPERYAPETIAADLGECRQRGLDWLDRDTTAQKPVRAVALQALAEEYVAARGLLAAGRIAQIKVLLLDGTAGLADQGHPADAALIHSLFFGRPSDRTIPPPGELLQRARAGENEARFRERRSIVMLSFAQFLIIFATAAARVPGDLSEPASMNSRYQATAGYSPDNDHFTELLASAVNATIIGITNERLLPTLHSALRRKREAGAPDAFWNSLRIVFLGKSLLHAVNDEREEFHDAEEALRQRILEATWARRSIGVFLKRTQSTRWSLYDWNYLPVLTGSLFEFEDRRKVAHLLVRPPRRSGIDSLFIDVEEHVDEFSAVFEDIVHHSASDTMIVPVGAPAGRTFQCNAVRLHARVLKDGSGAEGWLPMVIVITWRQSNGQVETILQLRTADNSAREENRLSHLGGHILQEDRVRPGGRELRGVPKAFDWTHEIPAGSAERLVREVTGADPVASLRPMETGSYLYPDKEHLYFFIFSLEVTQSTTFPRRTEMHTFRLAELVAIRASQVLRLVVQLCRTAGISARAWTAAAEVLALNLTLHDRADLGDALLGLADRPAGERAAFATAVAEFVVDHTAPSWASETPEVLLQGLAGWHYREFFSVLLPLYAELGIDGAAELHRQLSSDAGKRTARDRLAEIYQDEQLMALMPLEL